MLRRPTPDARRPTPAVLAVFALLTLGAPALAGCSDPSDGADATPGSGVLTLVYETKLKKILPDQGIDWEASGVVARDGYLHVVFDNTIAIGHVNLALTQGTVTAGEVKNSQYEGITYDDHGTAHYYVVKETDGDAVHRGQIIQLDEGWAEQAEELTDAMFEEPNSGLEGIAWLWANDNDYLLALCEANGCGSGNAAAGNGRIKVLKQDGDVWLTEAVLELPSSAAFLDYSDIALRDRGDGTATVAVVSQRSSAMWVGMLAQGPWRFVDSGAVYSFPTTSDGFVQYCSVEGVTFLDDETFAMVSDKTTESGACTEKDESVHVFRLP